jgi:hypothetical protein
MREQQKPIPWRLRELNAQLARRALRREALRRLALRAGATLALIALGLVLVLALAQETPGSIMQRVRRTQGGTALAGLSLSPTVVSIGTATTIVGHLRSGGTTLTLDPPATGAAATTGPSTLRVTATDRAGAPLPGITIWLTITGLVPYDGVATTDQRGVAAFTYHGNGKPYTGYITATVDGSQVATSTVQVGQPPSVTTTTVTARFYASDGRCTYDTPAGTPPLFVQDFPTINFEGRPFTDYGVRAGQPNLVAADGTARMGIGRLNHFNAAFTGSFMVRQAGDVPFTFLIDDAFNLGVGGGITRVSGTMSNPPPSGQTALDHLPVVGAFNQGHLEALTSATVRFPRPGTFPFEIDYSECMAGNAAIRISSGGQFLGAAGR